MCEQLLFVVFWVLYPQVFKFWLQVGQSYMDYILINSQWLIFGFLWGPELLNEPLFLIVEVCRGCHETWVSTGLVRAVGCLAWSGVDGCVAWTGFGSCSQSVALTGPGSFIGCPCLVLAFPTLVGLVDLLLLWVFPLGLWLPWTFIGVALFSAG